MAMSSLLGLVGKDFYREKPIKSYHSGRHQLLGNQELHYLSSHHTCRHQLTIPDSGSHTCQDTLLGSHCPHGARRQVVSRGDRALGGNTLLKTKAYAVSMVTGE